MPQLPDDNDRDRELDEQTAAAWENLRHAKAVRAELHSRSALVRQLGALFHAEIVENGMNERWREALDSVRK